MKKIITILLSFALIFGCVSTVWAYGQKIDVKVSVYDQEMLDGTVVIGTDEDGCYVLDAEGNYMGEALAFLAQVGAESAVIGINGDLLEINYQTLIEAFGAALSGALGEQGTALIEYFASAAFTEDMNVLMNVLSTEVTRIMLLANQSGLIKVQQDGGMIIEGTLDDIIKLTSDFLVALAANEEAFAQLSQTTIWQIIGLSEDGGTERAYLNILGQQLLTIDTEGVTAEFKIEIPADGGFTFYVKAGLGEDYAVLNASYIEGCLDASLDASIYGQSIQASLNGDSSQMLLTLSVDDYFSAVLDAAYVDGSLAIAFEADMAGQKLQIALGGDAAHAFLTFAMNDGYQDMAANLTLDFATFAIDGTITYGEEVCVVTGRLDMTDEKNIVYNINGVIDDEEVFAASAGVKIVVSTDSVKNFVAFAEANDIRYEADVMIITDGAYTRCDLEASVIEDGDKENLGKFSVAMESFEEALEHQSGYTPSAEELTQILGGLFR